MPVLKTESDRLWRLTHRRSLFHRSARLRYVSELGDLVKDRLYDASRMLGDEEDRVAELLGLPVAPRLSLVDEESASQITGHERAQLALERRERQQEHEAEEKADAEQEQEQDGSEDWRSGERPHHDGR